MDGFASKILEWSKNHGRKELPWQKTLSPYRVWVAEIMLQQTQVATVVRYFNRFLECFPDIYSLQAANREEVLSAWSGLGYYRRALNMHETANLIVSKYAGCFPRTISELCTLPGIGRTTAGSILATAWNIPAPILDANVRRVLSRYHGVNGPTSTRVTDRELWRLAEEHTPQSNARSYNQAIMDFGALWCKRSVPNCQSCPLSTACIAFKNDQVGDFPGRRNDLIARPTNIRPCVVFDHDFDCLLLTRGSSGIYANMWDTPDMGSSRGPTGLLQQLYLPCKNVDLMIDAASYQYQISNKKIYETLSIAKYNISSIELGTPSNARWTPMDLLNTAGLSVRSLQRIELAKALVESE